LNNILTLGLFKVKEDDPLCKSEIIQCVNNVSKLHGQSMKLPDGNKTFRSVKNDISISVDCKSRWLTWKHKEIMLIIFYNQTEIRKAAIPINSEEEKKRLSVLFTIYQNNFTENDEILNLYNQAAIVEDVEYSSNFPEKKLVFKVADPSFKNFALDNAIIFRICPFCSKKGSYHNVFYQNWWSKLPTKMPNIEELKKILEIIKKHESIFAKNQLKIVEKTPSKVWEAILSLKKKKLEEVFF
jgi:hypothetical protein